MDLAIFNDVLMAQAGLDPQAIGHAVIKAAVLKRMESTGCRDENSYLGKLQSDRREMESLAIALTVPDTWFLRERESFAWLKIYLKAEWLPRHGGQTLRILSIPCCTGEEPYSIAMTLLGMGLPKGRFVIDAFDINPEFLDKARRLEYTGNSFRGECASFRQKYFTAEGARWRLRPDVAEAVRFEQGNLLTASHLLRKHKYPVIFCRNLLIYMHAAARKQALKILDQCLEPDGLLFTGHSEIISQPTYRPVEHPLAFAYRRVPAVPAGKTTPAPEKSPGPGTPPPAASRLERARAAKPPAGLQLPRKTTARLAGQPAVAARTSTGCWGRIGTAGDRSCADLKKALHCRNCDVFTAAARKVFDQKPPAGYREELARTLAAQEAPRPEKEMSIIIFRIGPQWMALPSRILKGISSPQPVHGIPHRGGVFKGLVNIEGELHLSFDMERLLGVCAHPGPAAASARVFARLITLNSNGQDWSFSSDEIMKIVRVDCAALLPAAPQAAPDGAMYARGSFACDGKDVILLDEELLASSLRRCLK